MGTVLNSTPDEACPPRERLLEVRGLKTHFSTDDGMVHAVDGVDLHIDAGETLGVVGESGCGKSVTAFTIMRLIPIPPGRIVAGGGPLLLRVLPKLLATA